MSANQQNLLKEIKKKDAQDFESFENFGRNDIQLEEAYAIMKDLLIMMHEENISPANPKKEVFADRFDLRT
jgi:carboxyl-terminal processing protease